ncbi:MAG TPA: CAAX prenyl protease-related protein [Bryobacteraceae bacterium]|nr:CAAX prenyl protease-related protein [Bryobacteraceae bacterium]
MPVPVLTEEPAVAGSSSSSSIPYVAPFALFLILLATARYLAFLGEWEFVLRIALLTAALLIFSRQVISFRTQAPVGSVLLGVAVFAIWIAPDTLIPGYRSHWLFQNSITGTTATSIDQALLGSTFVLVLRSLRAVVLVPIIEELFWRAWLLRWLVTHRFATLPLGSWTWSAVVISSLLFASEHGPFWEVGLIAGLAYNWWMIRTKSLGDCILAHAVTNGCLCAWVVYSGNWSYWL